MNENLSQKFQKALASKQAIRDKLNEKGCNVGDIFEEYADAIDTLTKPQGTLDITENGEYDVTEYVNANVNVSSSGPKPTTIPTIYDAILYVDTSELTSTNQLYYNQKTLTSVPLFDTSKVTDMSYMFYGCSKLTNVPLYNTSNVTNIGYMFHGCSKLTSVPLYDTSKVTNMISVFYGCNSLTSIPFFDTSNVTSMDSMFYNCYQLTSIPFFDTSNITSMVSTFSGCTSLTSIPLFDTSNVTSMRYMFLSCRSLTSIPALDLSKVTDLSSVFYSCTSLTSLLAYGMKASFDISAGTLLEPEALVTILSNCQVIPSIQNKTLTMGTTLLAKLDGVYVKETGEELYEGITCRPCVICESTDEGAMLATDYITSKGWTLF